VAPEARRIGAEKAGNKKSSNSERQLGLCLLDVRYSAHSAALLATLGVVLVALCPLAAGPFTATHGPITALRAIAAAILLFVIVCFLSVKLLTHCESYFGLEISPAHRNGCHPAAVLTLRC